MVEYDIKLDDRNRITLKPEIAKILENSKGKAIADAETIVIYSEDTSFETVLKSLRLIIGDIRLRMEKKKRNHNRKQ